MSSNTTLVKASRKEVGSACFDYLYIEMVAEITRMCKDQEEGMVHYNLENMGYRVGQKLAERYTANKLRHTNLLEIIKYVCKDFWVATFKKQADGLRTNRRVPVRRIETHLT
mmetsp:Transcript_1267/g.1433  ORF Transcript_1267/g.1433 Transcript_1267/m.1433 type:complete len:112 (-) Transcript_1267:259-594(-)